MNNFDNLKKELDELRIDILQYVNNDDTPQDLMDQFFHVKNSSPETYELIVLIYNEFQLSNKSNKKQLINMIDKALNIKIKTVNHLITSINKKQTFTQRFINNINFNNILKSLGVASFIILFIFTLYEIDKDFINDITHNIIKIFTSLKE